MEDRRITKTKENIRQTLLRLLQTEPFERITVAEICREGLVSRITFYTYYENKYALLDEIFADYMEEADRTYHRLQKENNPQMDGLAGYENLLECILTLVFSHFEFFSHTTAKENPYLFSEFFNHVFISADKYLQKHRSLVSKYPTKQTAALICNGMFSVINVCFAEHMTEKEIRSMIGSVYRDILKSDLFSAGEADT